MAGTGVGGIKDSQGNYEIVGKGNSTLGTRSGTLSVPVGDVVGQTSGSVSANVYTASTLANPSAVAVNVQAFTPATPPTPAVVRAALQLGLDATGAFGRAALTNPVTTDGVFLDAETQPLTSLVNSSIRLKSQLFVLEGGDCYPSNPNAAAGVSVLDAFFLITKETVGAGSRTFTAPCDGTFTDAVCLINAPAGAVTIDLNANTVCTLAATANFLRRSTGFFLPASNDPVVDFAQGDTITVNFPGLVVATRARIKIFYTRRGAV